MPERFIIQDDVTNNTRVQSGIYGWRKRALYLAVIFLSGLILVNIGLTIWILSVLKFNVGGIGSLRFSDDGGLRLAGRAEFLSNIYVDSIQSNENNPLEFNSSRAILLQVNNSKLNLTDNNLNIQTNNFGINDIFLVNSSGIYVTPKLQINNDVIVKGTLKTGVIRSESGKNLMVGSPATQAQMLADNLDISSTTGDIIITAGKTIQLGNASNSSIEILSSRVYMSNLEISPLGTNNTAGNAYQVCVCASNRKLFLVLDNSNCINEQTICST